MTMHLLNDPRRPELGIFSDMTNLGHSLASNYGARADERGWPARLASVLGAELYDRHVDGAVVAWDDSSDVGDGGYFTCASYLDPKNTVGPYTAGNPLVSIFYGHNDHLYGFFTAQAVAALKASIRGCIGHARLAARFPATHATVRRTGANETGVGSWATSTPAVTVAVDGSMATTTGGTDEVHIDVPADFPGGAIWIFTLTGGGGNSTANGVVAAGATSLALVSAATFPASGKAMIQMANGDWDFFTYTGKSTNTLTGIPASGADALQGANSGAKVMLNDLEGGAFTVDVDGTPATPPAGQPFDTRNLGIPAAPSRISGHGWRIPIATAGAHEVTLKLTALGGGVTPTFYFNGWGIEAVEPSVVVMPLPIRGAPGYPLYAAYNTPPSDTTVATLRTEIAALAAEFDDHVFTIDADSQLNKVTRYFYQPPGSTLNGAVTAGATSITLISTANFPASGPAIIYDGGVEDVFIYTGKTATTLTGISATGVNAVAAHVTGLEVKPADGMHLSDEGHEVATAAYYAEIQRKFPSNTRLLVSSQRRRPPYYQRDMWKEPVRAASVGANVPVLTPPATLDGVTLARNDRILLKDQTNPVENGIYLYVGGSPPLIRDYDANSSQKFKDGAVVRVTEGGLHRDTEWTMVTPGVFVLGVSEMHWSRTMPELNTMAPYRSFWELNDAARFHVLTNMPRGQVTANAIAALATGRLTVVGGIIVPAGQTITAITFFSGATALATGTNQWFSLLTLAASPVTIRSTTNGTNGAWAANTRKTLLLSSPWTPKVDTPVMVGIMVAATTMPTLSGAVAPAAVLNGLTFSGGVGFPVASSSTGLTTPPADGTTMAAQAVLNIGQPYVLLT